jgi:hypothetical protein
VRDDESHGVLGRGCRTGGTGRRERGAGRGECVWRECGTARVVAARTADFFNPIVHGFYPKSSRRFLEAGLSADPCSDRPTVPLSALSLGVCSGAVIMKQGGRISGGPVFSDRGTAMNVIISRHATKEVIARYEIHLAEGDDVPEDERYFDDANATELSLLDKDKIPYFGKTRN